MTHKLEHMINLSSNLETNFLRRILYFKNVLKPSNKVLTKILQFYKFKNNLTNKTKKNKYNIKTVKKYKKIKNKDK